MWKLSSLVAIVLVYMSSAGVAQTIRAGKDVAVNNAGSVVMAGGASVSIDGQVRSGFLPISGVYAAGGSVRIAAEIDGPVFIVGSDISFTGRAKDVSATGSSIVVHESAKINGDLKAVASALVVRGEIDGSATLSGAYVEVNAQIGGDVTIDAEEIVIGPNAIIVGKVSYHGDPKPAISSEAIIKSEVVATRPQKSISKPFDRATKERAFGAFFWFVTLASSGVLMISLFPAWFAHIGRVGRTHPISTMVLGGIGLLSGPIISVVFMVIGIGLPVGAFFLASYVGVLALAFIGAGVGVGGLLFSRDKNGGSSIMPFIGATGILLLLSALPIVGGVVAILILAFGFGATTRGFWVMLRGAPS